MDGAEWLRSQLTSFACASCGRTYVAEYIKVLAHRDDLFFASLECQMCGAEHVAIVTIQGDESEIPLIDAGELERVEDVASLDASPVTSDDVLAMHEFLGRFDGDFVNLFAQGRGPGDEGAAGRVEA